MQFETVHLKSETGCRKMKPHGSIVKSLPGKLEMPHLAIDGWTWHFVIAGGICLSLPKMALEAALGAESARIKNRTLTSCQSQSPELWNDSKTDTICGYRFAMGAFGCKNWFLGAAPSFRFSIRNYLTNHSFSSLQEIDRLWVLQPNG